eukprot:TRINITY_DN43483_c0_g1_i1.p4 TRINITY_DN43483_c0_g1~~TRINITY_DN43483_c0_g1_i1.p4  ORF type:complete len:114 (+),score=26.83 TRINITY_DN43483_c0_g1_i1:627-968(+)
MRVYFKTIADKGKIYATASEDGADPLEALRAENRQLKKLLEAQQERAQPVTVQAPSEDEESHVDEAELANMFPGFGALFGRVDAASDRFHGKAGCSGERPTFSEKEICQAILK